jgi:hypothetical protein
VTRLLGEPLQRQKEKPEERTLEIFGVLKRKKLPFAKPTPIRGVHPQQAERRSAYRIATENKDSAALEVLIPLILQRMRRYMLIN